jgi:hypothetical protein
MSTKPRTSVSFTEPQAEYLKRKAEELGMSVSEYLRRIVDRYRLEESR